MKSAISRPIYIFDFIHIYRDFSFFKLSYHVGVLYGFLPLRQKITLSSAKPSGITDFFVLKVPFLFTSFASSLKRFTHACARVRNFEKERGREKVKNRSSETISALRNRLVTCTFLLFCCLHIFVCALVLY